MRVVSGSARGRKLSAPLPEGVRPTTDRVKESIFDMLGSLGGVADLSVVDLFCGSGALGIEALSRGASSVQFVDVNHAALSATKANLAAVGLDEALVTLTQANLPGFVVPTVDLVLADPPYDFAHADEVLQGIDAQILILESRDAPSVPSGWVSHRQRRYGGTLVTVLIRQNEETENS